MTKSKGINTNKLPDAYATKLFMSDYLREPLIHSVIKYLKLPAGTNGLDAGCGIGRHTLWLAEAVAPDGHITGLDLSNIFLSYARKSAIKAGLSDRVSFQEGNVDKLPFNDNSFDWAWSADCVGYATKDPLPRIKEIARVVRPGGIVAILGWSSQQLLPGYPILEAHLNATPSGIAPFIKGGKAYFHPLRALGWLRDAGLLKYTAHTFVGDIHAPLTNNTRAALTSLLQMRWECKESELSSADWTEFRRLCDPASPDFILDIPEYYGFFTYSLFQGEVPD